MSRVIVHIDLNAFFVRAEEIRNPTLENKAVAIGHLGRAGIVSTCSYKAREYGIHSGMPMSQAKKMCRDLIIIEGNYRYYRVLSDAFIHYVKTYTKIIEVASCDECYADFTECVKGVKDPEAYFAKVRDGLFQKTNLKCSIGVGPTKFLAKMGSDYKKPMGVTIIRKRDIPNILYPLKVSDTFGIGKKTAPRLEYIGVKTIGDLITRLNNDDQEVKNIVGKFGDVIKTWLNGDGDDQIDMTPFDPKSVSCSTTIDHDTDNAFVIKNKFEEVVHELVYRLNKENKVGATIQIMVKDTNYKAYNHSFTIESPTNDFKTIYDVAIKLYEKKYLGMTLRAVGVSLQNLISPQDMAIQMTLFDYQKHEEESVTKLLINELNRKLNKNLLKRASEVKKDGNN